MRSERKIENYAPASVRERAILGFNGYETDTCTFHRSSWKDMRCDLKSPFIAYNNLLIRVYKPNNIATFMRNLTIQYSIDR